MANTSPKTIMISGVTGAVGNAVASALNTDAHNLSLIYRDKNQIGRLSVFEQSGNRCLLLQADLTDANAAQQAAEKTKQRFGRIDLLVNATGGWLGGKKLHEHSAEDLPNMLNMDLIPTFNLMRAVLPVMVAQGSGKIVNFVALSAMQGGANSAVYAASKNAVLSLSQAAAEEYRASGVQTYCIAPGIINTETNRKSMPDADQKKWVSTDEIIETIMFLAQSESTLSGSILRLAGK